MKQNKIAMLAPYVYFIPLLYAYANYVLKNYIERFFIYKFSDQICSCFQKYLLGLITVHTESHNNSFLSQTGVSFLSYFLLVPQKAWNHSLIFVVVFIK